MPKRRQSSVGPSALFPFRADHALFAFEPLLKFANARVTDDNYAQLVTPGASYPQVDALLIADLAGTNLGGPSPSLSDTSPRTSASRPPVGQASDGAIVLQGGAVSAIPPFGEFVRAHPDGLVGFRAEALNRVLVPRFGKGAVVQLQSALRRSLARLLSEVADPLTVPGTVGVDFKVRGRTPYRDVPGGVDDEGREVAHTSDLQDYWYRMVRLLVAQLRGGKGVTYRIGGRARRLPFRPLARCGAPGCGPPPKFYFRKRRGDRTCGDRACARALDYQRHKAKRRAAGRPRSTVAIPRLRAKRRPAAR